VNGLTRRAERFGDFLTGWVDRLPHWLRRILPKDLVGFAILGAFTLGVDLVLLWILQTTTTLPLPVSVSIAYLIAFSLNFVLNRTVNFKSHAPVGWQAVRYGFVIAGDYLITLGVTTGLSAVGIPFPIARLLASACVALFTYSASRWWVFREQESNSATSTALPPVPAHASDKPE
jgi:putative flippase GtrA